MRALLIVLSVASLAFGLWASRALAYDTRIGALTSTDAGTSNSLTISPNVTYTVQCSIPSCYKTGTSTLTADCSTDFLLPLTDTKYTRTFDSSSHTKVAAKAVDAGNPACQVYQTTKNP